MPRPNRGAYLKYRADRDCYYIHWTEDGRSQKRSAGTGDREQAEAALASFIGERHRRGRPAGPCHPDHFPIADALSLYGDLHGPTTAAPDRIAYAIDALLPFWEGSMAGDISDETCRAYAEHRGRSEGTVRRELGVLRAAINFAHRRGRITNAPHVELPDRPEGKSRCLTDAEVVRLVVASRRLRSTAGLDYASAARMHLPLFILLAFYTGARKEAILSLRWPQLDMKRWTIDFNEPGRKRTNKGRAVIPVPRGLKVLLRLARERGTELGYVLHQDGKRIHDVKKSFARACRDAGLEDVTPHTLRHTCGTRLARQGVSLWDIAGWLGQSHARTSELYAHHHPDHQQAALRVMNRGRN
ncbi:tyrosine-type recombinase/integrase [uncultured Sphingomonas sp.]|uniref:tyrosine-type recombinase/integrase n=1 Tax=uncultured Sphingomonas sp. TaxID=158754 RepID=UPI0037486269